MEESAIPLGCKFDDFLPVVLDVRKAAQIIVPVSYTHLDVYKRQGIR